MNLMYEHGIIGKGANSGDMQSLINIANEAELNNTVVKTNMINKVDSTLPTSSAWNDVQNSIQNSINTIKSKMEANSISVPTNPTVKDLADVSVNIGKYKTGDILSFKDFGYNEPPFIVHNYTYSASNSTSACYLLYAQDGVYYYSIEGSYIRAINECGVQIYQYSLDNNAMAVFVDLTGNYFYAIDNSAYVYKFSLSSSTRIWKSNNRINASSFDSLIGANIIDGIAYISYRYGSSYLVGSVNISTGVVGASTNLSGYNNTNHAKLFGTNLFYADFSTVYLKQYDIKTMTLVATLTNFSSYDYRVVNSNGDMIKLNSTNKSVEFYSKASGYSLVWQCVHSLSCYTSPSYVSVRDNSFVIEVGGANNTYFLICVSFDGKLLWTRCDYDRSMRLRNTFCNSKGELYGTILQQTSPSYQYYYGKMLENITLK